MDGITGESIGIIGLILLLISFSLYLEKKGALFVQLTSSSLVFFLGMFFSSTGWVPSEHIVYAHIFTWGIPFAIACSLLTMDFNNIKNLYRPGITGIGLTGITLLIIYVSIVLIIQIPSIESSLEKMTLSRDDLILAAMIPKNISQAPREICSFFAGTGNYVIPLSILMCILLSLFLAGMYKSIWPELDIPNTNKNSQGKKIYIDKDRKTFFDFTIITGLSGCLIYLAERFSYIFGFLPCLIILSIITGRIFRLENRFQTASMTSSLIGHLFFFAMGTLLGNPTQNINAEAVIIVLFAFTIGLAAFVIISIHLGMDIETVLLTWQALVGGPHLAFSFSATRKWHALAPLALLLGIFSYWIGYILAYSSIPLSG